MIPMVLKKKICMLLTECVSLTTIILSGIAAFITLLQSLRINIIKSNPALDEPGFSNLSGNSVSLPNSAEKLVQFAKKSKNFIIGNGFT